MKTRLALPALLLATAAAASAAVLNATTAVHTKPDEASPAITFLKAGSEPVVAKDAIATAPAGWLAVELSGPFEGYVLNKDLLKSLDPRLGAEIHLKPKADSGVLTTFEPGDKSLVTGIPPGRWTQIRIEKNLVAYIHLGDVPGYLPPIATTPAGATPAPAPAPGPMAPAPVAPVALGMNSGSQVPTVLTLGDASGRTVPRLFAGKFVSTRSPFHPRRPFDWAINDDGGSRYAYLDFTKLPLTEQIRSYLDHAVVVYGAARPLEGGKDIVIEVESVQLK